MDNGLKERKGLILIAQDAGCTEAAFAWLQTGRRVLSLESQHIPDYVKPTNQLQRVPGDPCVIWVAHAVS